MKDWRTASVSQDVTALTVERLARAYRCSWYELWRGEMH